MSDALTLDGLTADRLTATLHRKGHVPEGRIERLTIESPQTTLISAIARLRLEWSGEQIVAVYARFHAAWWDDPRLGGEVGRSMTSGAKSCSSDGGGRPAPQGSLRQAPGPLVTRMMECATPFRDASWPRDRNRRPMNRRLATNGGLR